MVMGSNRSRLTSFIFMASALGVVGFSFIFTLDPPSQNVALTLAIFLFMLGHTGLLYEILNEVSN